MLLSHWFHFRTAVLPAPGYDAHEWLRVGIPEQRSVRVVGKRELSRAEIVRQVVQQEDIVLSLHHDNRTSYRNV